MSKTVWVAFVDTRYEVMAVADTEEQAIALACKRALRFLIGADALTDQTDSVSKVREYFGVTAREVTVGTAVLLD